MVILMMFYGDFCDDVLYGDVFMVMVVSLHGDYGDKGYFPYGVLVMLPGDVNMVMITAVH